MLTVSRGAGYAVRRRLHPVAGFTTVSAFGLCSQYQESRARKQRGAIVAGL
ncbi:hypothetical protein EC1094_2796 [Escherichia coli]|nr:hypothetical protein EC1094_2796 [Escherichia coli]SMZ47460.1 hypothetical protein EC1094V2_4367 [Escherichia coli]